MFPLFYIYIYIYIYLAKYCNILILKYHFNKLLNNELGN